MTPVQSSTLDSALAGRTTLLDFTAPWCTACKALMPTLLDLEARHGVPVLQVDVEDSPEVAERFNVAMLPTILVLEDGKVKARHVGAGRRAAIEALFVQAKG